MNLSFELHLAKEDLILAAAGPLSIVVWRRQPTRLRLGALEDHYRSMITKNASGFVSVIVIEPSTPNPELPLRRILTKAMDDAGTHLLGVACVLEARGFAAAALRAALTSMSMLTESRFPRRFVADVDEALAWLATLRDRDDRPLVGPDAARVLEAVRGATDTPSSP